MNFKVGDIVFSKGNDEKAFTVIDVRPNAIRVKCTHDRIVCENGWHTDADSLVECCSLYDSSWVGEETIRKLIYKPVRKAVIL